MKTIWKFPLGVTDDQTLDLPSDAKILTVDVQMKVACIWALVDTDHDLEEVKIRIHGTGHPIPDADRLEYISSFQMMGGGLVFHAFKVV